MKYALSEFFGNKLNDNTFKVLGILAFIFIFLDLLIIIQTSPADGYEISIYAAYPLLFWVYMIISITLSEIIIVSGIFDFKYWKFGILSYLFNYFILFFLPFFRNYPFVASGVSDLFGHLGFVRYIATSGYIPYFLIYPSTHIFAATLNLFSLSLTQCAYSSNFLFFLLYVIGFLLIGKPALKSKSGALFVFVFATPLMYSFLHVSFLPFFFAISFLPLIFYCLHNISFGVDRWEFHLLLIIISFCVVFLHPLVTIMLILFFSLYVIFYFSGNFSKLYVKNPNTMINFLLILFTSFFAWYFKFRATLNTVRKLIDSIIYGTESETIVGSQVNVVASSDASILFIAERFIKVYGSLSLYLLLVCFVAIYIFSRKANKRKANKRKAIDFLYSFQLIGGLIFSAMMSIFYPVIFEPIRALSPLIVFSTVLCGIGCYRFFENISSKTIKNIIIFTMISIVVFSNIMGVFNLYDSPWKGLSNKQMTQMESMGLDWYMHNANYSVPLVIKYASINKYSNYISPYSYQSQQIDEYRDLPSHFGYYDNSYLFDTFGSEKKIMITTELMRQAYLTLPQNRWNMTDNIYFNEDFKKLNTDPTVNKIFSNGEFEAWDVER